MTDSLARTDGSDWRYREVIADRYKRLVVLRKSLKSLTVAMSLFVQVRTAWFLSYHLLTGTAVAPVTLAIFGLGVALPLFYLFAFGFGKAHRERQLAIKIYGLAVFILLAEVVLTCYSYHVLWPKSELIPALLARKFPRAVVGLNAAGLKQAAQVFEVVLDVSGMAALGLLTMAVREYVLITRQQSREGAAKKD